MVAGGTAPTLDAETRRARLVNLLVLAFAVSVTALGLLLFPAYIASGRYWYDRDAAFICAAHAVVGVPVGGGLSSAEIRRHWRGECVHDEWHRVSAAELLFGLGRPTVDTDCARVKESGYDWLPPAPRAARRCLVFDSGTTVAAYWLDAADVVVAFWVGPQ